MSREREREKGIEKNVGIDREIAAFSPLWPLLSLPKYGRSIIVIKGAALKAFPSSSSTRFTATSA